MATSTTGSINTRMTTNDWSLLLLLSVIWGGSFFFAKVAVEDFGPMTVVLGRVGLAAIILNLLLRSRGISLPKTWEDWKPLIIMGVINSALPYTLIFWGEVHIASGLAAILNATTPIFTLIVAHWLTTDERLTPAKIGGVLLGMVGVVVIMGDDLLKITSSNGLAQLAVIGASLSYAFSGIVGRRLKKNPPMVNAAGQMTSATIILAPIALIVDQPWSNAEPHFNSVASIIALAVLSTSIAYLIFYRILGSAGASNVSLVTLLVPVSSLTLGALFLDEDFVLAQILGMALIATGLLVIDGRLFDRFRRPAHPEVVPVVTTEVPS